MGLWGGSDKLEIYEGIVVAVTGTTTDAGGIKYGKASDVLYDVVVYMPNNDTVRLKSQAPSQARSNGNIVAARVGDPCKVFVQGTKGMRFQVTEAAYCKACPSA